MSRGLSNNNPGNIRISSEKYLGEVIPSKDKSFKQFQSMAYGYRAIFVILRNYIEKYKADTIREIIYRWAPPNENSTENYVKTVVLRSGIQADATINKTDGDSISKIVSAISYVENGTPANENDILQGLQLAASRFKDFVFKKKV